MPRGIRTSEGEIFFDVHLVPRASRTQIIGWDETGRLRARVTSPPVEGAANDALRELLAEHLGIPARNVRLLHGESSREKAVAVQGISIDRFIQILGGPPAAGRPEAGARPHERS